MRIFACDAGNDVVRRLVGNLRRVGLIQPKALHFNRCKSKRYGDGENCRDQDCLHPESAKATDVHRASG